MKSMVLAALALFCTASVAETHETDWVSMNAKYRAWNMLCLEFTPTRSCAGIEPPNVKRVSMREGLRGYYDGGDTVYINRELYGIQKEATIVHEMSHYLDTRLGLNPEMPVRRDDTPNVYKLCVSEKRAWDLTDNYWRKYLRPGRAANGQWVTWYDHCRPFAHRLYPEIWSEPLPQERGWLSRWIDRI